MKKQDEYEALQELEIQTTRMRHNNFTALISISFLLPVLSTRTDKIVVDLFGNSVQMSNIIFLFGYIFFLFAIFHYAWYHRYSHIYRHRLKELENQLEINIYKLRVRPHLGKMKFHFDWFLYIIAIIYGVITASYVGFVLFFVAIGIMAILYLMLLINSVKRPDEPLE